MAEMDAVPWDTITGKKKNMNRYRCYTKNKHIVVRATSKRAAVKTARAKWDLQGYHFLPMNVNVMEL